MEATVREWLHLCFRWMHLIAGIMWIGNSLFFNWLDRHIQKVAERAGVEGELWMVHSGGFYQVEKKLVAPEELPAILHWFKWEAGFTWLSGICLLTIVYYMGGGVYLVDPAVSKISVPAATAIGVSVLLFGWAIYDLLVRSPLGQNGLVMAVIGFVGLNGVGYGLSQIFSGRAAYLHVGALMGTLMAGNVWMVIIPSQRHLVEATRAGHKPDATYAKRAKWRSIHNNYMTFPLLFIMISNHFPNTYGSHYSSWILAALMIAGAGLRHFMNVGDRSPLLLLSGIGLGAATALGIALLPSSQTPNTLPKGEVPKPQTAQPAHIGGGATEGATLRVVVRLQGSPPEAPKVMVPSGCLGPEARSIENPSVRAQGGLLQDGFVWISKGLLPTDEPLPPGEVMVDQRGCLYTPRVVGARVGQRVTFLNSDLTVHNVRTLGAQNPTFNEIMVQKDSRMTKVFSKEEIMVNTKCDIHPWMSAFIGVLSHPYFAVTSDRGEVELRGVKEGTYTVSVWHEVYGRSDKEIQVEKGKSPSLEFTYTAGAK